MIRPIKSFFHSINNLITWFPIIWKDQQWDQHYFFLILQRKLSLMQDFWESDKPIVKDQPRITKRIKICNLLLKRIIEDDYYDLAGENFHDKKRGIPNFKNVPCEGKPGYTELIIERDNVITEKDEIRERKEFRRIAKRVEELRNQDLTYLFKILTKYVDSFWD